MHRIFFNYLTIFDYFQGIKSAKLVTHASSRHDRLLKKIIDWFSRKEEDNGKGHEGHNMNNVSELGVNGGLEVTKRSSTRKQRESIAVDSDCESEQPSKWHRGSLQHNRKKIGLGRTICWKIVSQWEMSRTQWKTGENKYQKRWWKLGLSPWCFEENSRISGFMATARLRLKNRLEVVFGIWFFLHAVEISWK